MTTSQWVLRLWVSATLVWVSTYGLWLEGCNEPIGMQSGDIPDDAITASSSHNTLVGPQYARVRVEEKGGAWCPKDPVDSNSREFLEVDLDQIYVITATGTQGRFGNGFGQEYTEYYKLEYWRPGLPEFVKYVDGYRNETLRGNRNTYMEEKSELTPPIIASKIRFLPYSTHVRTICLRVELYGCNYTSGLLSYSSQNGFLKSPGFLFQDDSYDGTKTSSDKILNNGLGQLYDGESAESLTNLGLVEFGKGKGWEWVGWPNNGELEGENDIVIELSPLQITFTFDTMRNFSLFALHSFYSPQKGFVVPTKAEVFFSEDGKVFDDQPLRTNLQIPGKPEDLGLNITMNLQNRPGRVLKVILHFPKGWLVLSEVYFISEPCICNLSDWSPNEASAPAERTAGRDDPTNISPVSAVQANSRAYMGIIIGFLLIVVLLLAGGFFVYYSRLRKEKTSPHTLKSPLSDSGSLTFDMRSLRLATSYSGAGASMYGHVSMPEEDGSMYHEPYKTPLFSSSDYSVATIGKQYNEYAESTVKKGQSDYAIPMLSTPPPPFNSTANTPFTSIVNTPYNTNNNTPYLTTPVSGQTTPFTTSTSLHSSASKFSMNGGPPNTTQMPQSGTYPSLIRLGPATLPTPPVPPPPEKYLVPPQICTNMDILSPFGTALYHADGSNTMKNRPLREIPRPAVHIADKLGEGSFGMVCAGEIVNNYDNNESNGPTTSRQVIVCLLSQDAPPEERKFVYRQAQTLGSLQDPHLECLLGIVSRDEPFLLILEQPTLGDLNQYLRKHVPDTTTPRLNHMRAISYGSLIYIATQIASGMKYLESKNITHRDLATRNINVEPGQLIKIGSLGSCRSLYAGDYYRVPGDDSLAVRIPIRWMSWEAAFLGNFTSKSDVWSFGVTLWEILTLGRQQPYEKFTDEGVVENLAHYHHNDGEETILPQTATCPKEIYDFLQECWRRSASDRPNFRDIHLFLHRKNHGFSPMD